MNAIMPHGRGEWKPTKYKVNCCDDIIWSSRPGLSKTCKCGNSYVDETRQYVRLGGDLNPTVIQKGEREDDY